MMRYLLKISQLLIALTFLLAANSTIGYAQNTPTISPRQVEIVGGQAANPGEYPWQVSLSNNGHFCGGSLITPEWVLTAAHCIVGESAGNIQVIAGAHNIRNSNETTRQTLNVAQIISHAQYDDNTLVNDIALLRLSQPATLNANVATISYANSEVSAGTLATVTGWGTLSSGGSAPDQLQEVSVPIVSHATCNQAYNGRITDGMVCAGLPEGGKDSCQGDSGGPLVIPNGSNGWLQVGVVSWGEGCAAPNAYGVYTKISQYTSWIQANMNGTTPPASTPTPSTSEEQPPVDDGNGEGDFGDFDEELPEGDEFGEEGDFGEFDETTEGFPEGDEFGEEGDLGDETDDGVEMVDWFTVSANTIGISEDAFWQALDAGQSIADIATANNVNPQMVVDAIIAAETNLINQVIAAGYITQEEGTAWISELPQFANEFVGSTSGRRSSQGMTISRIPSGVTLGHQVFVPVIVQ